jgi:hypothetical protein
MRFRPTDRDDGLRRVSRLTRWLAGGALALIGGLSALVAQALPGASGTTAAPTSSGGSPVLPTTPSTAPATAPPVQSTSPPATSDPNFQPAPAPVITHHHSVATSGGT